jgi:tRNA dimethylallyltransferase
VAEARGPEALHERLVALDPDAAARIHPRNVRRTVRALEVIEETGDRFSARRRARGPEFPVRLVGLRRSRDDLAERISRRVAAMLAAGLESEVRALVAAGYGFDLPAMSGVGYGEWAPYLAGTGDLADVATAIKTNTQRLARRQRLWFRGDDERIRWLDASGGVEAVVDEALRFATADHSEPRD